MDPERDLAELLRDRRPRPDRDFVAAVEERLFRRRRAVALRLGRRARPAPVLRLGAAFAVGLAALTLVLSLAGVGPLAGGDRSVQAGDGCRTVGVTRVERVPTVVTGRDGRERVVRVEREVTRLERRC